MGRRKKTSEALENGRKRETSLRSINPNLDLGNDLTLSYYSGELQQLQDKVDEYNLLLSRLDGLSIEITTKEKNVRDLSERMLMGVRVAYGRDSHEYKMAGGTPLSERKRRTRSIDAPVTLPASEPVEVKLPAPALG